MYSRAPPPRAGGSPLAPPLRLSDALAPVSKTATVALAGAAAIALVDAYLHAQSVACLALRSAGAEGGLSTMQQLDSSAALKALAFEGGDFADDPRVAPLTPRTPVGSMGSGNRSPVSARSAGDPRTPQSATPPPRVDISSLQSPPTFSASPAAVSFVSASPRCSERALFASPSLPSLRLTERDERPLPLTPTPLHPPLNVAQGEAILRRSSVSMGVPLGLAVFDVDDTLVRASDGAPIPPMVELVHALVLRRVSVHMVTGRLDDPRGVMHSATLEQLAGVGLRLGVHFDSLTLAPPAARLTMARLSLWKREQRARIVTEARAAATQRLHAASSGSDSGAAPSRGDVCDTLPPSPSLTESTGVYLGSHSPRPQGAAAHEFVSTSFDSGSSARPSARALCAAATAGVAPPHVLASLPLPLPALLLSIGDQWGDLLPLGTDFDIGLLDAALTSAAVVSPGHFVPPSLNSEGSSINRIQHSLQQRQFPSSLVQSSIAVSNVRGSSSFAPVARTLFPSDSGGDNSLTPLRSAALPGGLGIPVGTSPRRYAALPLAIMEEIAHASAAGGLAASAIEPPSTPSSRMRSVPLTLPSPNGSGFFTNAVSTRLGSGSLGAFFGGLGAGGLATSSVPGVAVANYLTAPSQPRSLRGPVIASSRFSSGHGEELELELGRPVWGLKLAIAEFA